MDIDHHNTTANYFYSCFACIASVRRLKELDLVLHAHPTNGTAQNNVMDSVKSVNLR